MADITVQNLTKYYGDRLILKDISFDIQPGDQLLLMADKKRGIALVGMDDLHVPDSLFRLAKEADDDGNSEA